MKIKNKRIRINLTSLYPDVYLTKREAECVHMLLKYTTRKKIAENLGISFRTVDWYLMQVKKKLGLKSNIELACAMVKIDFEAIYQHFIPDCN